MHGMVVGKATSCSTCHIMACIGSLFFDGIKFILPFVKFPFLDKSCWGCWIPLTTFDKSKTVVSMSMCLCPHAKNTNRGWVRTSYLISKVEEQFEIWNLIFLDPTTKHIFVNTTSKNAYKITTLALGAKQMIRLPPTVAHVREGNA